MERKRTTGRNKVRKTGVGGEIGWDGTGWGGTGRDKTDCYNTSKLENRNFTEITCTDRWMPDS